ncbi:MAG TPA: T9SS type A sorting domain-containing protein [Candidatus Cloacimonadota bacterium]|nr:T9SS type A sorting domain-containing protein [Candidatus Cloacimonadota bacterium]
MIKRLCSFAIFLPFVVSIYAQYGNPITLWSQVTDNFPNSPYEYAKNILVIDNHICFTVNGSNGELSLIQINKTTGQQEWQCILSTNPFGTYDIDKLAKTPDNNIAVIDSTYMLKKISVQTGEVLWSLRLNGIVWLWQDSWSIASISTGIVCWGDRLALIFVNNDGQVIGAHADVYEGYCYSYGYHGLFVNNNEDIYLYQQGQYYDDDYVYHWKTVFSIAKISSTDYSQSYTIDWIRDYQSGGFQDECVPKVTLSNGNLYLSSIYIDYDTDGRWPRIRRLDPSTGEVLWVQDIDSSGDIELWGLLPNATDVLGYGLRVSSLNPVFVSFNENGSATWMYDVPLPIAEVDYKGVFYQTLWDNNVLYCAGTFGSDLGLDSWISCLSTSVSNNDHVQIQSPPIISCYPNPFRGSVNIEIKQLTKEPTSVSVYNIKGQLVNTLLQKTILDSEKYNLIWDNTANDGTTSAAGVYFIKIKSGTDSIVKKVTLLK